MASEVDVCNLALGYLGDDATVASLDPPEGSAQADHCARFYPMARDMTLEGHQWNFNTKRAALALLTESPPSSWQYAYAMPADALDLIAILDPTAPDDISAAMPAYSHGYGTTLGVYTPQTYVTEVDATGVSVIYTNQINAVLRYTALVIDPGTFPPTVVIAIAQLLASMLAGPVLKGETGMKGAQLWASQAADTLKKAKMSDANQQRQQVTQNTSWLNNR